MAPPPPKVVDPTDAMISVGVVTLRRLIRDHILTQDSNIHQLRMLCREIYSAMVRESQ